MPEPDAKPVKDKDLAERLADPAFRAQIEEAVASMPPEKAAELVAMLEQSLRRRKIELVGYLAAAVLMLVGMVLSLWFYGASDGDSFMAWIFLVPLALAGLVMWAVGRWSRKHAPPPRARPAGKP